MSDGTLKSAATATVTVTVTAVNDDPVAVDDAKDDRRGLGQSGGRRDRQRHRCGQHVFVGLPRSRRRRRRGTASVKATDSKVIEYTPNADRGRQGQDRVHGPLTVRGGTDSGTLTITITAVNDDPAFSEGTVSDGVRSTTRSVTLAGSTMNSDVGAVLAVTHPSDEAESLTFAIGGTDGSKFVVSSSGQISVGSTDLPVATQQTYEVTVTVSDGKGQHR